jgi:N-acetylglucosamine repressor
MDDTNDKYQRTNKQSKNLQLIKETNFTLVFNMIYKYRSISRAQLSKITRLSPTTVSSQVDELLQKKLVVEIGAGEMGTSGRKPIMISINESGYHVISIEMLKDGFDCFLYNLVCKRVDFRRCHIDDFTNISDDLIKAVLDILEANHLSEDNLIGITVGVPGLIDYEKQCVISSTIIPVDGNNDFFNKLKDRFKSIPLFMENESSLCAYAEKVYGHENNVRNLIFIDVGIGIGAGIILNGNMYRGSFGLAGEIGHIAIDMNGPKCKCGSRGCLETMASIPSMVQNIIFAVMSGRETVINDITQNDLNKISIDVISRAVAQQDKLSLEVIKVNATRLAFGINNMINLFNPQTIVIGGEIVKLGEIFLDLVKECLNEIELKPNVSKINVRFSSLEENASTLGGARYMLDTVFHTPKILKNVR